MKAKDLTKQFGLSSSAFEAWLKRSDYRCKVGALGGIDIDDNQNIEEIVRSYQRYEADRQSAAQQLELEQQRLVIEKRHALANMLITSGFGFEGYSITKYSGYISGDDVVQIARGRDGIFARPADVGASLMASLTSLRKNAIAQVMEAAFDLGCNAVIGLDFDYLTLDPETVNAGGGRCICLTFLA